MFSENVINEIRQAAQEAGLEPAALLAVTAVESAGQVFALVEGRQEPLIRFEGHYFDRRLSADKQALARERGLASPTAGAVANPGIQADRWKMLKQAAAIDAKAAYESVSWGLGQVMGAHWQWLGYGSVEALVDEARSGAFGQVRLMVRYIEKAGLVEALRNHDWQAFAHGYNGPGYKKNAYDEKIADTYGHYATGKPLKAIAQSSLLRPGSQGEAVADLQRRLTALGYPLSADGIFGPATLAAVERFQADNGLDADGLVGKRTGEAIQTALVSGGFIRRLWTWLKRWLAS
ncbi:peptidoglycan-binding protein [Mesorhizobium sp. Root157]|uniref:N-acetylmuramidase domain-containing protein n=1 Tax=Mesorhizobium sp. Root157 TaxID=1736477 RepID=UPI0006F4537E|nr:N-acetylmuramidase domain-containing protein [Mesorhizobium sp. Root157]KQZ87244.1 peptidoglycan-binding protein [Mesorhizobium sp. Root157]